MVDTTFLDKIKLVFSVLKNNTLIGLILLLVIVVILDLLYGRNKKGTKILYIVIISLLTIYMLISYYKPFLNIFDTYISNIFRIAYFPSIIEYVTIILITIFIQIISCFKCNKVIKNINLWLGIVIEVLFMINLIAMSNITVNLNTLTSIYNDSVLLSIFQLSSIIFILWIIFNIIALIILTILDNRIEMPRLKKEYYY